MFSRFPLRRVELNCKKALSGLRKLKPPNYSIMLSSFIDCFNVGREHDQVTFRISLIGRDNSVYAGEATSILKALEIAFSKAKIKINNEELSELIYFDKN